MVEINPSNRLWSQELKAINSEKKIETNNSCTGKTKPILFSKKNFESDITTAVNKYKKVK